MTEKQKTFRERDNDNKRGKKRFIERMAEDHEAQQAIEEFLEGKDEEHYENRTPIRNPS